MLESPIREPLIKGDKNYHIITQEICLPAEKPPGKYWYLAITISLLALFAGIVSTIVTIYHGIGTWGLNRTVGWGWAITNFVWWIGIGHAGTLISAILLIFKQKWRTAISRSAEAMTIFALMCAGFFPIVHMGRPWLFFFIIPYPNTRGPLWVNFNSALVWDFFAISTYFIVSFMFWYIGLIPDIATLRDRTTSKLKKSIYKILSFGWDGSINQWHRHEVLSLILAGLATPLVVSVHSIVSMDFATSIIPGWHTTIFPPYFVTGAIFSGFAMVQTLVILTRKLFKLEDYITLGHIESMNKILLLTGSIVGLAYFTEVFIAWYSNNPYEYFVLINRAFGPYKNFYWSMITFNVLLPQILWFKKLRRNPTVTFAISIFVNIGMWIERFIIVTTSLHRDYLPSSWTIYSPTIVEIGLFIGTLGFFFTAFLLFAKFFPIIAIADIKSIFRTSSEAAKIPRVENIKLPSISADSEQLVGIFKDEKNFIRAIKQAIKNGFSIRNVFTPFPVHEIDEILKLKHSRIPNVAFIAGVIGALSGFLFQVWINTISWPLNFGGKPHLAILSFIPVTFELTILFSAIGSVLAFLYKSKLFPGAKQATSEATDDRFIAVFDIKGEKADKLLEILYKNGVLEVKEKWEVPSI
jgi:molybdopterin-containing oxidoreductase family membrane subunit